MSNIIKKVLKVEGMHCASCALNIDFDLEDVEGVKKAHTSYAKQNLEVEYDESKVNIDKIVLKIHKLGYKVCN